MRHAFAAAGAAEECVVAVPVAELLGEVVAVELLGLPLAEDADVLGEFDAVCPGATLTVDDGDPVLPEVADAPFDPPPHALSVAAASATPSAVAMPRRRTTVLICLTNPKYDVCPPFAPSDAARATPVGARPVPDRAGS